MEHLASQTLELLGNELPWRSSCFSSLNVCFRIPRKCRISSLWVLCSPSQISPSLNRSPSWVVQNKLDFWEAQVCIEGGWTIAHPAGCEPDWACSLCSVGTAFQNSGSLPCHNHASREDINEGHDITPMLKYPHVEAAVKSETYYRKCSCHMSLHFAHF